MFYIQTEIKLICTVTYYVSFLKRKIPFISERKQFHPQGLLYWQLVWEIEEKRSYAWKLKPNTISVRLSSTFVIELCEMQCVEDYANKFDPRIWETHIRHSLCEIPFEQLSNELITCLQSSVKKFLKKKKRRKLTRFGKEIHRIN